eukprot:4056680-Ditylum_brightwellii.AAC.1
MALVTLNAQQATIAVCFYAVAIAMTTPVVTAVFHTAFVYGCLQLPVLEAAETLQLPVDSIPGGAHGVCALAIALGYGLQDLIHWLCDEKTLMSSYIKTSPLTLIVHTAWLMPL